MVWGPSPWNTKVSLVLSVSFPAHKGTDARIWSSRCSAGGRYLLSNASHQCDPKSNWHAHSTMVFPTACAVCMLLISFIQMPLAPCNITSSNAQLLYPGNCLHLLWWPHVPELQILHVHCVGFPRNVFLFRLFPRTCTKNVHNTHSKCEYHPNLNVDLCKLSWSCFVDNSQLLHISAYANDQ